MTRRPGSVLVRPADPADAGAVARLDDLSPATRRLLPDDLAATDRRATAVAVTGDGSVVGFAMTTRQDDAAHVLDIVVAPPWRGLATRLLQHVARVVVADGTPALTLEVRASNDGARALYEGLGFEDVGVRPGYYRDGEDAHVLWHRDPATLIARHGPT